MNEEHIIIEADYGISSVLVDCEYIRLTEQELDSLSTAIWTFHYEATGIDLKRQTRKLIWEFSVISSDLLGVMATKLINVIQELFPDKLVEFSVENKYD